MSNQEILQKWEEAYAGFTVAFDSPNAQRLMKGAAAEEARRRLREFNELLDSVDKDEKRDSERLGKAIAEAAMKAGIYNGEVLLTGLHLTVLADNMAQSIISLSADLNKAVNNGWIAIAERLPSPYKNVPIGGPGMIKGIAWHRVASDGVGVWETDQGICEIEFTHWYEIEEQAPIESN